MDASDINRCINRLAHEIVERTPDFSNTVFIGIRTRGVVIAHRLSKKIKTIENVKVPVGALDITLNRDDLHMKLAQPAAQGTDIAFDIEGKSILLVDDVLYTGRTIQAALEAIKEFGRPRVVRLIVFIDRGGRELPIHADHVGKAVETPAGHTIQLQLMEIDETDQLQRR